MHGCICFDCWQRLRRLWLTLAVVIIGLTGFSSGSWVDEAKAKDRASKPTVTCVAGCDAPAPHLVQRSPDVKTAATDKPDESRRWTKPATGVWCHKSGGCRGYDVGRYPRRRTSVIMIYRDW